MDLTVSNNRVFQAVQRLLESGFAHVTYSDTELKTRLSYSTYVKFLTYCLSISGPSLGEIICISLRWLKINTIMSLS